MIWWSNFQLLIAIRNKKNQQERLLKAKFLICGALSDRKSGTFRLISTVSTLFWLFYRYKQNAQELQRRFQDRPQSPLDVAIYWIEYVIRHKGAEHLQPTSLHLNWYQYHLLDVALFLIVVLAFMFAVIKYFTSWLITGKKFKKDWFK